MLAQAAQMMPAIAAQESLDAVAVMQVGSGTVRQRDARKAIAQWQRTARADRPRRMPTPDEWRARLALIGIEVVDVRG